MNITLTQDFDPYGNIVAKSGNGDSVYQFTGEARDGTGLTFLRARYLDTDTGRFLSRDVIQGMYFEPQTTHKYTYVENNPITRVDPTGLISEKESEDAEKIVDRLYQTYGIKIHKDWGFQDISMSYYGSDVQTICVWNHGSWRELRELQLVSDAIDLISNEFGSAARFRRAMKGDIRITRINVGKPIRSFALPSFVPFVGDIGLTDHPYNVKFKGDEFTTHTIIHEVGHVWDIKTGFKLSLEMAKELETWVCVPHVEYGEICSFDITKGKEPPPGNIDDPYAGNNRLEDWADSFATYIYDDYYDYFSSTRVLEKGGIRERFIREQINSLQ
jgi:RHS repeat-associated protein